MTSTIGDAVGWVDGFTTLRFGGGDDSPPYARLLTKIVLIQSFEIPMGISESL